MLIVSTPESTSLVFPTACVASTWRRHATRRQFWELIYQAAERGITVFVTTHYMDEAEYCNRISMMVDGKIEALDTPQRLKERFHAQDMDEVFRQLARKAVRS